MTLDELISALIVARSKGGSRFGACPVHIPAQLDPNGLPQTKPLETVEKGRRQVWLA